MEDSPYVFGLKEYAEKHNVLDSFKDLKETRVRWRHNKKQGSEENLKMIVDTPKMKFKPLNERRRRPKMT